ncbi:MAG: hypothetical protein KKF62_07600 [Bacteroidetes bacterium]|nr:hypothetical protein [Bacteroidota bacterium]MBU1798413.1 hypothetical protein [Bacteroidota bacterium]
MKKISLLILLYLFFYSCGDSNNENFDSESQKKLQIDSNISKTTEQVKDTTVLKDTSIINEENSNNILDEENSKSTYQIKSISELWKQYKFAKAKADKFTLENNLDSIIVYFSLASEAAYELSREDIATWQLNNIGYYSINEFKKRTDYDKQMQKLATVDNLKEKALLVEKVKFDFKNNFVILNVAEKYLQKAKLLDSEMESSDRTKIIESNIQFIEWIRNYISNNNITDRSENLE